jgi:hypothetical protein
VTDIADGVYVNTVGSDCGGYTVTDGPRGQFYVAYQARGGKQLLGDPLSRPVGAGRAPVEQFFDAMVLATSGSGGRAVHALPVVAMLAKDSPGAYRRARLPPVRSRATAAERRRWLTNPSITRAYLDGEPMTPSSYAAAVRRYGEPLGPPAALSGAGVQQAFADVVLDVPAEGGSVHAVPVTPAALGAGVLGVPARARVLQQGPTLPNPYVPGPPEPTTAKPFALTLSAALLLYGGIVDRLAYRRRGGPRTPARPPRRDGGTL